jgi:dolichyl-phosphate beta-glucosyltransferase
MRDFLSVVVPAYNESARIRPTIEKLNSYLKDSFSNFEIIVVDDGSSDNTSSIVKNLSQKLENLRLVQYSANTGKGYAIKKGVLASVGELLLTCDADQSAPIEELEKLLPFIRKGCDIAVGSRGLHESDIQVRQPWYRERMGKIFNIFVRTLVFTGILDTQCGFKLFKGDVARKLFEKSRIKGFSFDVEILFLAKMADYKIKEVPIKWINSPSSKVRLITDPLKMFFDLLRIRTYWIFSKYKK